MISRKEIMQLSSGREIDILIAEQVMGWQLEADEAKLKRLNKYFSHDEERRWWRKPEGGWHSDPPSYSSDIVAAWEVVDRMNNSGKALFMIQSFDGNKVAFDEPSAISHDYITERMLMGAICKAALVVSI
jgi:hypothetical protein